MGCYWIGGFKSGCFRSAVIGSAVLDLAVFSWKEKHGRRVLTQPTNFREEGIPNSIGFYFLRNQSVTHQNARQTPAASFNAVPTFHEIIIKIIET